MATTEDVEDLLVAAGMPFTRLDDNLWVVVNEADHGENLVIYKADTVITFRLKLFELPQAPGSALFRRLLELNAESMVHGAYGIEGNAVVMVDAIESANLDLNELTAVIDAFEMALAAHHAEILALLN